MEPLSRCAVFLVDALDAQRAAFARQAISRLSIAAALSDEQEGSNVQLALYQVREQLVQL